MPGPRNSKRQKKLNAIKEKKRKESQTCRVDTAPIATPKMGGNATLPGQVSHVPGEKDTAGVEKLVGLEGALLREPPVYDPGTGPRVKSMGEFLRSSFASEPTWDDELCAEFAQEEMLEMLREILPEEMALVSVHGNIPFNCVTWAVMNLCSVCGTTKADVVRVSALPVGGFFKPGTCSRAHFKVSGCPRSHRTFIRNWWQSRGSADYVRASLQSPSSQTLTEIRFCRFHPLFRHRVVETPRSDSPHIWTECG